MSKMPAFQFYSGDWLKDPELRACTLAARGLWIDCLCVMSESQDRGVLRLKTGKPVTPSQLARMVGATESQTRKALAELEGCGVLAYTTDGAICSKRMVEDEKRRQQMKTNGEAGGRPKAQPDSNQDQNQNSGQEDNQTETKTRTKREPDPKPNPEPNANQGVNLTPNQTDNQKGGSSSSSSSSSSPSGKEQVPSEPAAAPPAAVAETEPGVAGKSESESEPPPVKPKKPAKPPTHPHGIAIADFCDRWQAKYGEKYPFDGGKDAGHIADLLKKVDGDPAKLSAVFARFLADSDPFFAADSRHGIGKLRQNFQRWLVPGAVPGGRPPFQTKADRDQDQLEREFAAAHAHLIPPPGVAP